MKRFPSNLSAEDRRTYRRWLSGLFLSYLIAVTIAMGVTFTNDAASDLRASNETKIAHSKVTTGSTAASPMIRLTTNP